MSQGRDEFSDFNVTAEFRNVSERLRNFWRYKLNVGINSCVGLKIHRLISLANFQCFFFTELIPSENNDKT